MLIGGLGIHRGSFLLENSFLIDWLSFTIPLLSISDLQVGSIRNLLHELGLDFPFEDREKGRYGYNRSLSFADSINVLFNDIERLDYSSEDKIEQALNMGVHIEFTGQGCRYFENVVSDDWISFFNLLNSINARYSRLDIALDDYKRMLNFAVIEEKVKAGEVVSASKKRDVTETVEVSKQEKFDSKGESKGKTIYFGTRGSSIYIRFYDKKKEQEGKGIKVEADSWQRYEIVLRKEKAEDFIFRYCSGETFDSLYLGVIAGAVRFVDKGNDTNKARWKTSVFWEKFLKNSEIIKLKSHEVTPDIEKTIKWFETAVLGSLEVLEKVSKDGNIDLYELLKNAKKKVSDRHRAVYNSFDVLKDKDKQEIYDKIKEIGII